MTAHDTGETDTQLLARAVGDLARRTRFPVAFGGLHVDGAVRISTVVGNRTPSLEGLTVRPHRGLGGKAMTELRPRMTVDYRSSRTITHDYDAHVLGEGISTLLAVPVIVDGAPRGVLYGGTWHSSTIGDSVAAPAFQVADALAAE
ncbi:MAG TPA: GAF domain-containing protein, partial [Microbacterium sp.]